jgi:hypothetical protein
MWPTSELCTAEISLYRFPGILSLLSIADKVTTSMRLAHSIHQAYSDVFPYQEYGTIRNHIPVGMVSISTPCFLESC